MSTAVCTPRRAAPGATWPGLLLAFLCLFLFLFVGNAARANEAAVLEQTARDWIQPALVAALPADGTAPLRTEVEVGSLDSRLRLAPCDKVEPFMPPGSRLWGRSRIGLRCVEGARRWNVYLPVTVKAFGPAWVLKRPVGAGATLTQEDAELAEVDWAAHRAGVLVAPERWVGQETAFSLTPGQALREHMVRPMKAFEAGAQVRVTGGNGGFRISATGQAMTTGLVGQNARVRLPGGKVVNGLVQADQTVELAL
jgi:flagellar basal body P-ring formation protein FlgA